MTVNMKSTFKKDQKEYNGLDDDLVRKGLIEEPLARRYVVAMIETSKVVKDIEAGGTLTPVVRIISIEACDGDDAIVVKEILDKAFKSRTGRLVEPTLFDRDDPQANEDAEHVSEILNGALPFAAPDSDQTPEQSAAQVDGPQFVEPPAGDDDTPPADEPKPRRGRK